MADERIAIHHCSNKCRCLREINENFDVVGLSEGTYCSAYIHGQWQKIDPEKDCKNCKRAEYEGMSRTEAIERMANAMSDPYFNGIYASESDMLEELAKAALDALISLP